MTTTKWAAALRAMLLALALCPALMQEVQTQATAAFFSQGDLPPPALQGPFDNTSSTLCFGFQFSTDFEGSPVETFLTTLFRNNNNPLLNPYVTLNAPLVGSTWTLNHVSGSALTPLYYPLANGTFGAPNVANPITGRSVYSYALQLEDRTCLPPRNCTGVTTALINRVLANLGVTLKRNFPPINSRPARPGVLAYQITTFFVRTDPTFISGAPYTGVDGQPLRRSCRLV